MSFKRLKHLLLLSGLTVLFAVSCASRPDPEPLPPGFKDLANRWEKQAPLCSLPVAKFKAAITETQQGPVAKYPAQIVKLFESVNWKKENTMRSELKRHYLKLPVSISDADYASVVRIGCSLSPYYAGAIALVRAETGQMKRAPSKRSMKVIEQYVGASPTWTLVELSLQWMVLRDLSISNYYSSRIPRAVLAEMDGFSAEIQQKRVEFTEKSEPRNNFEAYTRLREDAQIAFNLQPRYDAILRKLRPVYFR